MPIVELTSDQLLRRCDPASFDFETTADLQLAADHIIGQPRGVRAIEFGLGMDAPGYNIFALGETGTGRMTTVLQLAQRHATARPAPADWAYVHNFAEAHKPRALSFPPGAARKFAADVSRLTAQVKAAASAETATALVAVLVDQLKAEHAAQPQTLAYLEEAREDLLRNLAQLREPGSEAVLRRYAVNVIVDHAHTQSAPVVVESLPTSQRLAGWVEGATLGGAADFTHIHGGALHQANGGYLVLRARDLWDYEDVWDTLRQALLDGRIRPEGLSARAPVPVGNTLQPEPIPLDVKVILVGPSGLYSHLYWHDDDFEKLFKVRADFDTRMERAPESEREYAQFLAARCAQERLCPFDRGAAAKMVEIGSRLAASQRKLSVRFGDLANLAREANYWAGQAGRPNVTAVDVGQAWRESVYRVSLPEERERERFEDGSVSIDTSGEAVGQVNGLTTSRVAGHTYGQPSRVAARAYAGGSGITQIDREVNLAGPIHNKGVLTLIGYLGGQYSSKESFSFSAQLTFEQNYTDVDGDSASCAELYAILSSLTNTPLKQNLAVTGTLNQRGQVQPIGAAVEKIEGFFDVCARRGLTGEQGVIIPAANREDLCLREDVTQAVADGKFHVWTVTTVDEGLELLTGQKAEEIHKKARERLKELDSEGRHHHRPPRSWLERLRHWFHRIRRKASASQEPESEPGEDEAGKDVSG